MKCPHCGSNDSHVTDTTHKANENAIKRRRECLACGGRYSTLETISRRTVATQTEQAIFIIKNERQWDMKNLPLDYAQDGLELEATYQAALKLVARIDYNLERGIHYRTRGGCLLTTLDEVIRAILNDELPPLGDEPAAVPLEQPGELVLARAA